MSVVNDLYFWTDIVLIYGTLALRLWALVDCLTRKAAAFPAVGKQTKPLWLAIIAVSIVLTAPVLPTLLPLNIIPLVGTIAVAVYLADVRPAVREITGGSR